MHKIFDWILDVDNCRTHPALLSSITGEVLVRTTQRMGIYTTEVGRKRTGVAHSMMLGNNAEICKSLLKGELDYCLTSEDKLSYASKIKKAADFGGKYTDTKRDKRGNLYFVDAYWNKADLEEITKLLESQQ